MIDSLEREIQVGAVPPKGASPAARSEEEYSRGEAYGVTDQIDQSVLDGLANPSLRGLLQRIMDGTEPYDRPLHPWEPKKFSPVNINTILMLAAGWRNTEVSRALGLERGRISTIKHHPYGRKLMMALLPESVRTSLDTRSRMKAYAGDMLEKLYEVGMTSEDPNVVARIGFGMMDRAGYGPVQKVDQRHRHEVVITEKVASRLTEAMAQSQRAREVAQIEQVEVQVLPAGGEGLGPSDSTSRVAEGLSGPSSGHQSGEPHLRRLHA